MAGPSRPNRISPYAHRAIELLTNRILPAVSDSMVGMLVDPFSAHISIKPGSVLLKYRADFKELGQCRLLSASSCPDSPLTAVMFPFAHPANDQILHVFRAGEPIAADSQYAELMDRYRSSRQSLVIHDRHRRRWSIQDYDECPLQARPCTWFYTLRGQEEPFLSMSKLPVSNSYPWVAEYSSAAFQYFVWPDQTNWRYRPPLSCGQLAGIYFTWDGIVYSYGQHSVEDLKALHRHAIETGSTFWMWGAASTPRPQT